MLSVYKITFKIIIINMFMATVRSFRFMINNNCPYRHLTALHGSSSGGKHGSSGGKNTGKFTVNPNWKDEYDESAITSSFDKMAMSEGVDVRGMTKLELPEDFDDGFNLGADEKGEYPDFLDEDEDEDFDDDEEGGEILDFGNSDGSMDERINAAKSSASKGYVTSVDDGSSLDTWSTANDLPEDSPEVDFDFEPRVFEVIEGKLTLNCPGCGVPFQSSSEMDVGYLPSNKMLELKDQIEARKGPLGELPDDDEDWSTDDEIDWLLSGGETVESTSSDAESPNSDPVPFSSSSSPIITPPFKPPVCQRCHGLKNFGRAPQHLTSSDPTKPLLTAEAFKGILTKVSCRTS